MMDIEKLLETIQEAVEEYRRIVGIKTKPEKTVRLLNQIYLRVFKEGGYLHEDLNFSTQISPQFDRFFHDAHNACEEEYLRSTGGDKLMSPAALKRSNLTIDEKTEKVKEYAYAVMNAKRYGVEHFQQYIGTLTTDAICAEYNKYKQIYSFDKDFINILKDTEQTKIPAYVLDHLPYPAFCLDFSDNSKLCDEIQGSGVLVYVIRDIDADNKQYHRVLVNSFSENSLYDAVLYDVSIYNEDDLCNCKVNGVKAITMPLLQTVVQAITYLSSTDKDLEIDDKKQAGASLPKSASKIEKARFHTSENKVGYHFGAQYREHMQSVQSNQTREGRVGGYSDKPVVVRAHWHKYWCGQGRTELQIRWVNPYFRNIDKGDIEASIHPVKTSAVEPKGGENGKKTKKSTIER